MAAKATPEEKEAALKLEKALEQEELDALTKPTDVPGPAPLELDPEEVEPRRPGRPKGSGSKKTEDLLHQSIDGGSSSTASPKKPGRPTKSENKSIDPGKLGNQLVGIHQLAAMFTNTPELQLTPEAGRALGEAVVNVCNEYNLNISGKTSAAVQLLATSAMIYAPMIMAIRFRQAQEQLARDQANAQNIPGAQFVGPTATN